MTGILRITAVILGLTAMTATSFAKEGREKSIDECLWSVSYNPGDIFLNSNISLGTQYTFAKHWTAEGSFRFNPFKSAMGKSKLYFTLNANAVWWAKAPHKGFWLSFGPQYQFRKFFTGSDSPKNDVGLAGAIGYSFKLGRHWSIDLGVGGWGGMETNVDSHPSWYRYKSDRYGKTFLEFDRAIVGVSFLF